MKDKIINAVAMDGTVRIIAGTTTNLVEKVREIHECTPVAAAALGRMITAGALLGTTLKSDKEILILSSIFKSCSIYNIPDLLKPIKLLETAEDIVL